LTEYFEQKIPMGPLFSATCAALGLITILVTRRKKKEVFINRFQIAPIQQQQVICFGRCSGFWVIGIAKVYCSFES
jgi:hypothetical protein